jgi:hypothetical protein
MTYAQRLKAAHKVGSIGNALEMISNTLIIRNLDYQEKEGIKYLLLNLEDLKPVLEELKGE